MTISAINEIGYEGDPIHQMCKDINAALTQANTDIAAAEESTIIAALDARFNRGTTTLVNGQTAIVVTHGLGVTPLAGEIVVCPIEDWGAMTSFWVHTLTSTQFTITADQDPGADVDFAWQFSQAAS